MESVKGSDIGALPPQEMSTSPATRWLIAGFLCLGACLRIYNFWVPELWIDEYGTWWAVTPGSWTEVARRVLVQHGQSPLYYFLVKPWIALLSPGTVALRLPSILFGVGTLALVYPLGLRLFHDRHAALLALAVFAVNEPLIWYAQEARPYALALFCTLLSFLCYVTVLQTDKPSARLGYVLATAAVYYAHYLFGFIIVIQLLHLLWTRGWSGLISKQWLLTWLLLALICLPGGVQVVGLFGRREALNWVPPQGWTGPLDVALEFLAPGLFAVMALVVLTIGVRGLNTMGRGEHAPRKLLLVWFLLPVVWFGGIPPLFGITLLSSQYVLFVLPAALFITAWLMASGRRAGWRMWIPLGTFVTLSVIWYLMPALQATGTFSKRHGAPYYNQGWAKAAEFLKTFGQEDDLILLHTGFVEADHLPGFTPDSLVRSFIRWPLVAHLPSGHPYRIVDLPFRLNADTRSYLAALLSGPAQHHRVWVIGLDEIIPSVAKTLIADPRFQLRQQMAYGVVQVIVLEQLSGS